MVQVLMQQMGLGQKESLEYAQMMSPEELTEIYSQMVVMQFRAQMEAQVRQSMASVPKEQLVAMLTGAMQTFTQEQLALYYDEVTEFSEGTYEENLKTLGAAELDDPATISLYASSFENKDILEAYIADYNASGDTLYYSCSVTSLTIICFSVLCLYHVFIHQ